MVQSLLERWEGVEIGTAIADCVQLCRLIILLEKCCSLLKSGAVDPTVLPTVYAKVGICSNMVIRQLL